MARRQVTLTRRDVIQSGLRLGGTMMATTALVQGTAVAVTMDPLAGSAKADEPSARSDAARAVVALPEPQKEGGLPLMQALALRRTTRTFADRASLAAATVQPVVGRLRHQPRGWSQDGALRLELAGDRHLPDHEQRRLPVPGGQPLAPAGRGAGRACRGRRLSLRADRRDESGLRRGPIEAGGLARATRQAQPLQRGGRGLHHPERLPVLCLGRVGGSRLRRHRQGCAGPNAQGSAGTRRSSWRRPSAIHRRTERRSRMARCPSRSQMLQSQDGAMLLHDSQERAPLVEAGAACRGPAQ